MGKIRRPMAAAEWVSIDIYAEYARLVKLNLEGERYFEAVAVAVICLDVLLHHMLDGLLLHHRNALSLSQIEVIEGLERARRATAGDIIDGLKKERILSCLFIAALRKLNRIRNALVHPFAKGHLKRGAILPWGVSKEEACKVYRLLCRIIDAAGGRSPLKEKQEWENYVEERRQQREKSRWTN